MTATQDKTLTIIPGWSEDNSNGIPGALKAFLASRKTNYSV